MSCQTSFDRYCTKQLTSSEICVGGFVPLMFTCCVFVVSVTVVESREADEKESVLHLAARNRSDVMGGRPMIFHALS